MLMDRSCVNKKLPRSLVARFAADIQGNFQPDIVIYTGVAAAIYLYPLAR